MYKVPVWAPTSSPNLWLLPLFGSLEMHHANPRMDLYRRETALRDPKKAFGPIRWQDTDDSVAAWLLGAAQTASVFTTLRLGDGCRRRRFESGAALSAHIKCSNVMRTYAVSDLLRLLPRLLQTPAVALSLHVDVLPKTPTPSRASWPRPQPLHLKVLAFRTTRRRSAAPLIDCGLEACACSRSSAGCS